MYIYEEDLEVTRKQNGNLYKSYYPAKDTTVKVTDESGKATDKLLKEHLEERFQNANEYANNLIEKLVGAAPETLDTIYELAQAIQENDNVLDALDRAITEKLGKTETAVAANVAILNPKPIITLPAPQLKTYTHIFSCGDYKSILLYKVPTSACNKIGICGMLMEDRGSSAVWSQQNAMCINTCYSYTQNINQLTLLSEMATDGCAKLAKVTYENEQYIALIKLDPASSFYFTGATWGNMLFKEVETTSLTVDYTNVSNFYPQKRIKELENINENRRYGTRVVTVTGNYVDLEIENTSGAIVAYASIGNMTSETAGIHVVGCTILNSNKIRVFLNQEVQGTLLRINYFVTKVE